VLSSIDCVDFQVAEGVAETMVVLQGRHWAAKLKAYWLAFHEPWVNMATKYIELHWCTM
jgi:hypothetical protein